MNKNVLTENKKFKEIIEYIKEHLQNAEFTAHAVEHTNKLFPKSEPLYSFCELTGKTLELEVKNALEYSSYKEALKNGRKYFFIIKSEPLGSNEFPDFLLGIGETKKKYNQELFWLYLENKIYTSTYSFGTSSLDSLLDNILTKIGEPNRLEGKLKKVDKLTTPILIEKFSSKDIDVKSKKFFIEDLQIFQMYEILSFNSKGGFTTKNREKNLMVSPVSNANCTICGSIDDWLREFKNVLNNNPDRILLRNLHRLGLSAKEAVQIINDRLVHPLLYQDMRSVNYDHKFEIKELF